MVLSRSSRIILLLAIDVVFFLGELIVGYSIGSLALVADSFHMLSDVMSLVVALYAIKMMNKRSNARYSYGWQRAEILAALINGVFLLALCLSIFLEAIQRMFSKPEVSNPKLVVIIGACGLASNIVGLFLFHEHGHSHDHLEISASSHAPADMASTAEGLRITNPNELVPFPALPDSTTDPTGRPTVFMESASLTVEGIQVCLPLSTARRSSQSQQDFSPSTGGVHEDGNCGKDKSPSGFTSAAEVQTPAPNKHVSGSGHSMNMRAIMLHVFGDALGNIGVIVAGLIIWLTTWSFKFYFDPIISLVITVIILASAFPLVRSTASILLQGVPPTISLEEVRDAILQVRGVLSLHELHIWQLSESKVVASMHVTASRDQDFMHVAAEIQQALHHRGIHSSTIQPEYTRTGNSSTVSEYSSCLISCPRDMLCSSENTCCPSSQSNV